MPVPIRRKFALACLPRDVFLQVTGTAAFDFLGRDCCRLSLSTH